ncbi:MAG: hypothetical protein LBU85_10210 [Treponema sp.]|jgi:hypothetical protein|nr:hypothetical protein [Treponema sp.]
MKKNQWIFAICFLLPAAAFAQTAAEIEKLLETEAVSYEQAAWFVLEAAGIPANSPEAFGRSEAFSFAAQQRWMPPKAAPQNKASLEGVSLLIMKSFGIRGGLFYSLLKSPHYAYREMVYKDIIQGRADPQMPVSGDLLLFLVNRVLSRMEEQ